MKTEQNSAAESAAVAIVGMAGKFPGAENTREFWMNLREGKDTITRFEETPSSGTDGPRLIRARGAIANPEYFDAGFFGFSPHEASLTDPQHRIFLQCCYEALENAGCAAEGKGNNAVGVFAGTSPATYLLNVIGSQGAALANQWMSILIGNDKDFLTTRVSYKLDLCGPSMTVQTACSTSLVAVQLAWQSLLNYECDVALAGGVCIHVPQDYGYVYVDGTPLSADGRCRAFDRRACGFVPGNGAGVVVLKRLADAQRDRDNIRAIIKGCAVNNDGSLKVGYTAPSIERQAEVIMAAQTVAEVDARSISYIETHGTGTRLGDPIEFAALTRVFRESTSARQFCAIGSVKTNIGHLDAAAGVAGLIKAVLALEYKQIPPSSYFEEPNPEIDLENSPFFINSSLLDWQATATPRRAGVSSFGIGGTNAHVILEEAPEPDSGAEPERAQLLVLSAKTQAALNAATANLARHLAETRDVQLSNVGFTLQTGRRQFEYRRVVSGSTPREVVASLEKMASSASATRVTGSRPSVVFMFPGQGTQYPRMGVDLYREEPVFRAAVDGCAVELQPSLGCDIRKLLYDNESWEGSRLHEMEVLQPALFVTEYALAKWWQHVGIAPQALIGHSVGEYVAACLAGVFTPADALKLLVTRGRLMASIPEGSACAVALSEQQTLPLLKDGLSLAACNGPDSCVVSGGVESIEALVRDLSAQGIGTVRLPITRAVHSGMMDPILDTFAAEVAKVPLNDPQLPLISNLTGTWITREQAKDPLYWAQHLRKTVRFMDGVAELLKQPGRVLLEVGPRQHLKSVVSKAIVKMGAPDATCISSMPRPQDDQAERKTLLDALGATWMGGLTPNWSHLHGDSAPRRIALPTYPFQLERYWITSDNAAANLLNGKHSLGRAAFSQWFYAPVWKQTTLLEDPRPSTGEEQHLVIFADDEGIGSALASLIVEQGGQATIIERGNQLKKPAPRSYVIDPAKPEHYREVFDQLQVEGRIDKIIHLWAVGRSRVDDPESALLHDCRTNGPDSLVAVVAALEQLGITGQLELLIVSSNSQDVLGAEALVSERALVSALTKVISQEYANINCKFVDLDMECREPDKIETARALLSEFGSDAGVPVAYRNGRRWIQGFERIDRDVERAREQPPQLRQDGTYLITGGLGRIGLTLAEYLAREFHANLVLVARSSLPPRELWRTVKEDPHTDPLVRLRLEKLLALEELGGGLLLAQVDVADQSAVRQVIDEALRRFGALHGVIHAAGLSSSNSLTAIAESGSATADAHLRPKALGLYSLAQAVADQPLDFCLLMSSLSVQLGGLGMASYASANAFMDAFAARKRREGRPWQTVNWDAWSIDGWNDGTSTPASLLGSEAAGTNHAITASEGVEAFDAILRMPRIGRLVVSVTDIAERLARSSSRQTGQLDLPRRERPQLAAAYVAPRSESEKTVCEILQEVLGLDQVGVNDSFFDLGGDSLIATVVVSRLRAAFGTAVPIHSLLADPTPAAVASKLDDIGSRVNHSNELDEMLNQIELLSEDEVEAGLQLSDDDVSE